MPDAHPTLPRPRCSAHAQGRAGASHRAAGSGASESVRRGIGKYIACRAADVPAAGCDRGGVALFAKINVVATCCSSRRRIAWKFRSCVHRRSLIAFGLCYALIRFHRACRSCPREVRDASQAQHLERARAEAGRCAVSGFLEGRFGRARQRAERRSPFPIRPACRLCSLAARAALETRDFRRRAALCCSSDAQVAT